MTNLIKALEDKALENNPKHPQMASGDTVKVHVRIIEGTNERIQVFQGVVIRLRGGGQSENFTVRRISNGVGVERTFLLKSPRIAKIEILRSAKVRRANLYYLRGLSGKAARLKERRTNLVAGMGASTTKDAAKETSK